MPKVSVIVPVYNTEKYLEKCLDSLVNQTLDNIEIIIINDGTTDNAERIILEFQKKYESKIKYLKKQNGGLSDSRNYGLKHAKGEYVGFVDSDDYVDKDMYKLMYEKAKKEDLSFVECNFLWIYETKVKEDKGREYIDKKDMLVNSRVMVCNKLIKKDIIDAHNIQFPLSLRYEDIEFFYKMVPYTKKTGLIEKPMYFYVQRETSISNYQNEKTKDIFTVLEGVITYYKKNGLYEQYKEELEYIYIRFLLGSSFLRMVKIKDKVIRKKMLMMAWDKLDSSFPNWRKNKYLKQVPNKKNLYYRSVNSFTFKLYSILFHFSKG